MSNEEISAEELNEYIEGLEQNLVKAEQRIAELERELKYVDEKVTSARLCHPNAVQTLLEEAANRTHFKQRG